jgi:mannose-1-phosphate guanylyltransferase
VLAGGIGSRFWPVSTPARPKQLLPLASHQPLIRDTVDRILPLVPAARLRIVANETLGRTLLASLPGLGADCLMAEPAARGTAAALTWAAFEIRRVDPAAVMISLHADHAIASGDAFRELLVRAARAATSERRLFTIGVQPTRPETGYGYVAAGAALEAGGGARAVDRFVEKPDRALAERYVREGFYWNTGMFIWRVDVFLEEIAAHTPELARLLPLLERGDVRGFFAGAPELSIDHGLLERSGRVGMMVATFGWDDVGAWDAVARTREGDADGNVAVGASYLVDSKDCIAWAEEGCIVTFGASGLVVVRAHGITLVAARERAADLKRLLDRLPPAVRAAGGEAS